MDFHLKGKVAVVTGGTDGIGLAAAKGFVQEGAYVAVCGRHKETMERAARELKENSYGVIADMTKEESVYAFAGKVYQHFGRIDIWVNNVGATIARKGKQYSGKEIDAAYKVCFKSTVMGSQAALPYLKRTKGVIINVSSLAARCATAGRATLYGPMKSAVVNYTNTFAGETASYGIRVVCVMPGFTLTPLVQRTVSREELRKNAEGTLLHRAAVPEEIAKTIVFLASDAASFITSTTIEVSGGRNTILNPSYSYQQEQKEIP